MASLDFETEKNAFKEYYEDNWENLEKALNKFKELLEVLLNSNPEIAVSDIGGRIKDREECLMKFTRKYRTELEAKKIPYSILSHITDLLGLRIVCLYEDDVERISDLVLKEFDPIGEKTDKIAQIESTENAFGYKGLHLDLRLNGKRQEMFEYKPHAAYPFELQIRTVVQDSWSIIDHKIKYKKSIPNNLKRRINTLAALFELADREFRAIRDATKAEIERAATTYDEIESETSQVEASTDDANVTTAHPEVYTGDLMEIPRYTPLDAFNFLRIARHFFPGEEFEPHKVDGFTQQIVSLKPGLSRGKFNFYLKTHIADVKKYKAKFEAENEGDKMNPFTVMRHCLYKGDRQIFAPMLTDAARARFDGWLSE